MTKRIVTPCLVVFLALFSFDALAQQTYVRQLGGACGVDTYNKITATCDIGLECRDGYCAMRSFLSGATVSCKTEMGKVGYTGYVAVHSGFCYVDSNCRGLYDAAMYAHDVTERLLRKAAAGSEAFAAEVATLSDGEKTLFKRAEDICKSCSPYCVIGSAFLGLGGY
ncbi:MAG: hypothetical protein HYS63_01475 [Methylocystis sp.]|nr:hypothetical protein [Methylocystis sp.]